MDKFQDLLTQAAQLKQSQLKQQRKNFEALPQYLKSGLNFSKKYEQLRKQHYYVQLHMCQKIKGVGNKLFALKDYPQALSKYQEALSIFRYIHAKKYQNLKDEDIIYENYKPQQEYQEDHKVLLVALYLNICSSLTKMNKKQEAIHSSEQAIKLKQTAKGYYKKAQAYLQYINKDKDDIKLGFYYLNKSYELSKDQSIIVEMHRIKRQIEQQRQKQQKWFKFMFQKNKNARQQINQINSNPQLKSRKQQNKLSDNQDVKYNSKKRIKSANNQLQQFIDDVNNIKQKQNLKQNSQLNQNNSTLKSQKTKKMEKDFQKFKDQIVTQKSQSLRLQQGKQKLKKYLSLSNQEWKLAYQQDFVQKNGSKIYSIIQLYNFKQYLIQFRSLLAKCLQIKGKTQNLQHKNEVYEKFFNWIFTHPIQKYQKYIDRYNLQIQWIQKQRTLRQNNLIQEEQDQMLEDLNKLQNKRGLKYLQKQSITKKNEQPIYKLKKINQNEEVQQVQQRQQTFKSNLQSFQKDKNLNQIKNKQQKDKTNKTNNQNQQKYQNTYKNSQYRQMSYSQNSQIQNTQTQHAEEVPEEVKRFLQDYGELDNIKKQKKYNNLKNSKQQQYQQKEHIEIAKPVQKDYMNFFYTFIVVVVISSLLKLIF